MRLGSRKQGAGFISRQGVYESPRPPQDTENEQRIVAAFLKIELGGKAILGLSRLDYPLAKTGASVNGGAESAIHLDR